MECSRILTTKCCRGGTLARYAAEGAEVMVVSATRGQAGQIRDARGATRHTLGAVREAELRQACAMLGVHHVECLDFFDGTLKDVACDDLVSAIVRVVRTFRPTVVITFGEDGAYGHPEHVAISAAASRGFELAGTGDYGPICLYHSHFARSRMLLLDRVAEWLVGLEPVPRVRSTSSRRTPKASSTCCGAWALASSSASWR